MSPYNPNFPPTHKITDLRKISTTLPYTQYSYNLQKDKRVKKCVICGDITKSLLFTTCKKWVVVCSGCRKDWKEHIKSVFKDIENKEREEFLINRNYEGAMEIDEKIKETTFRKTFCEISFSKTKGVCSLLESHHALLKDDPERLSTQFIKQLINKKEDPCPEISD